MTRIYLDHAATTPCDPAVVEAMLPYFRAQYGNPSGLYAEGRDARQAIDEARDRVAYYIGATRSSSIVFTSSGSEADNLALQGAAWAGRLAGKGNHIVVSAIEHSAVLQTARHLQTIGFRVSTVPVDEYGRVDPEAVRETLTDETVLVSVMHANNEVGTIQPVAEIAALCRERDIPFHTDAVQTVGHLPVDVEELGVDMLTLSAHKFYGPKGVGALYIRPGLELVPQIHGGAQERERRAGTENVAGIVGLSVALEIAVREMPHRMQRVAALRDRLIEGVLSRIDGVRLNGHPVDRLPGNAHFAFEAVDGESLLLRLDMEGIAASSGSACSAGSIEPSPVLLEMGLSSDLAVRALRLTLGHENNEHDVERVLEVLPRIVSQLRGIAEVGVARRREQDE